MSLKEVALKHVAPSAPVTNRLLDRLPAKDRAHVLEGCEKVELTFAEVISEPGAAIRYIYFPTGGFISLLTPMGKKNWLEVALAGSEGIYGVAVALGSGTHALAAR